MSNYLWMLLLWALVAYFAGCCIGCMLKKLFSNDTDLPNPNVAVSTAPSVAKVAVPAAAAAATAAVAAAASAAPRVATPTVAAPVAPQPVARPVVAPVAAATSSTTTQRVDHRPRGISGARGGKADNLLRISGVGPQNEKILHGLGVYHFDQIASWTPEQVAWVDDHMKFNGRISREQWIRQARLLADGNDAEFNRLFGTGGEGAQNAGVETRRGSLGGGASSLAGSGASSTASSGPSRPKGMSAARGGKADDLQRISGVGPKNEKVLHSLGFYHFAQIAEWSKGEAEWVDDHLKFGGRVVREKWVHQSKLLAEGREAEFTRLYGTGGLSGPGGPKSGSRTRRS